MRLDNATCRSGSTRETLVAQGFRYAGTVKNVICHHEYFSRAAQMAFRRWIFTPSINGANEYSPAFAFKTGHPTQRQGRRLPKALLLLRRSAVPRGNAPEPR